MPKTEKPQTIHTNIRLPVDIHTRLLSLKEEKGFEDFQEAQIFALTEFFYGKTVVDKSVPENCKTCVLYGGFFEGKVHCVSKIENKPSIIKKRSLIEAQACSTKSILITLFRKEEFEHEINNLTANRNYYLAQVQNYRPKAELLPTVQKQLAQTTKELSNLKQPHEELLNEKNTLELKVTNMGNTLIDRNGKIAVLETDNAYKDQIIQKLSESELLNEKNALESKFLKENDGLHFEITGLQNKLNDYGLEVEKLEALTVRQRQILNEVVLKTNSVFRDFKQFLPTSFESSAISEYIKNMQKKIEQFEGYLATVNP